MATEVIMQTKPATTGSSRTAALRRALRSPGQGDRNQELQQLIATSGDPDNVAAVPILLRALATRKQPEQLILEALRALGLRRVAAVVDQHMNELILAARERLEPTDDDDELPELD
jgi:Arc/MetJ family transcription regulator